MKAAFFLLFLTACGLSAAEVTLAGLTFTVPGSWKSHLPQTPTRLAEWQVGEEGTVAVLFFGSAHADPPEKTLERWSSTMTTPQGTPVPGHITTRTVDGGPQPITITEIDLYGTYLDPRGGPAPGLPVLPRPQQGLLGAVLSYTGGPLYLSLTGPEELVRDQEKAFARFADSARTKETR